MEFKFAKKLCVLGVACVCVFLNLISRKSRPISLAGALKILFFFCFS